MFKVWIVFPTDMQPTLAQVKTWNTHVHELRGVHWGTERDRPDVLAVEIDSDSFQSYLQHCEDFDALVQDWLRRGVEIRNAFDFVPSRTALKPVKRGGPSPKPKARIFTSSARINEPEIRETSAAEVVTSHASDARNLRHRRVFSGTSSPAGPWLVAGAFAAGTIVMGFALTMALRQSGMESRRDTIERLDESTRKDPRINESPQTQINRQADQQTSSNSSK